MPVTKTNAKPSFLFFPGEGEFHNAGESSAVQACHVRGPRHMTSQLRLPNVLSLPHLPPIFGTIFQIKMGREGGRERKKKPQPLPYPGFVPAKFMTVLAMITMYFRF